MNESFTTHRCLDREHERNVHGCESYVLCSRFSPGRNTLYAFTRPSYASQYARTGSSVLFERRSWIRQSRRRFAVPSSIRRLVAPRVVHVQKRHANRPVAPNAPHRLGSDFSRFFEELSKRIDRRRLLDDRRPLRRAGSSSAKFGRQTRRRVARDRVRSTPPRDARRAQQKTSDRARESRGEHRDRARDGSNHARGRVRRALGRTVGTSRRA